MQGRRTGSDRPVSASQCRGGQGEREKTGGEGKGKGKGKGKGSRSRMMGRRRKGSAGRAASLVSPGPLPRPCPAGRHARVGGSFRNNPVPKDEPNAKLPQQSRAKTR